MMFRFAHRAVTAFESLLSLDPRLDQERRAALLDRMRRDLAERSDREILTGDFARAGEHIRHAKEEYRGCRAVAETEEITETSAAESEGSE